MSGVALMMPSNEERATHYAVPADHPRFFLPRGGPMVRDLRQFLTPRACLSLFARTLSARGIWRTERALYRESATVLALKAALGCPQARSIVSVGTPGPYNKATVIFTDAAGEAILLAKVGLSPASVGLLKNEAAWLARLGRSPVLAAHVPSLLFAGAVPGGFAVAESVGPGNLPSRASAGSVRAFLDNMQANCEPQAAYHESTMRQAMWRRRELLAARVSETWAARGTAVLDRLDEGLSGLEIPMVVAHRDFSAWNMRVHAGVLFVFDWEYCEAGYLPLYDWYHYRLMPIVQRRVPSTGMMSALIREAAIRAGLGPEKGLKPDFQMLAYLADVCFFYLESNDGRDDGDVTVNRYGMLIDRFDDWRMK